MHKTVSLGSVGVSWGWEFCGNLACRAPPPPPCVYLGRSNIMNIPISAAVCQRLQACGTFEERDKNAMLVQCELRCTVYGVRCTVSSVRCQVSGLRSQVSVRRIRYVSVNVSRSTEYVYKYLVISHLAVAAGGVVGEIPQRRVTRVLLNGG